MTIDNEQPNASIDDVLREQFAALENDFVQEESVDLGMTPDDTGLPAETVTPPVEEVVEPPPAIETPPPVEEVVTPPPAEAVTPPVEQPAIPAEPPIAHPDVQFEAYRKQLQETEKQLEKYYQLTAEEAQALKADPAAILPKLAARLVMDTQQALTLQLSRYLPRMVAKVQQEQQSRTQGEQMFFEKWPMLKKPEHRETLLRLGQVYRQMNPTAPAEKFIQEVGAQAMIALKIPFNTSTGQVIEEQIMPPQAHRPAQPQARGAGTTASRQLNPFEQLANEILRDDI